MTSIEGFYLYDSSGGLMLVASRADGGIIISGQAHLKYEHLERFRRWLSEPTDDDE